VLPQRLERFCDLARVCVELPGESTASARRSTTSPRARESAWQPCTGTSRIGTRSYEVFEERIDVLTAFVEESLATPDAWCAWAMLLTIASRRPTPAWSVRMRLVSRKKRLGACRNQLWGELLAGVLDGEHRALGCDRSARLRQHPRLDGEDFLRSSEAVAVSACTVQSSACASGPLVSVRRCARRSRSRPRTALPHAASARRGR
jgi:hypothetical protein